MLMHFDKNTFPPGVGVDTFWYENVFPMYFHACALQAPSSIRRLLKNLCAGGKR